MPLGVSFQWSCVPSDRAAGLGGVTPVGKPCPYRSCPGSFLIRRAALCRLLAAALEGPHTAECCARAGPCVPGCLPRPCRPRPRGVHAGGGGGEEEEEEEGGRRAAWGGVVARTEECDARAERRRTSAQKILEATTCSGVGRYGGEM